MERHPQWDARLHDYLTAAFTLPHAYGRHDCLLHAGKAIEAVTGADHHSAHRGKYRSEAGAVRYLRQIGHGSPEAMLDALLEEIPIGFAQRGDIALVSGNGVPVSEDQPVPSGAAAWNIPAVVIGGDALVIGRDVPGLHRIPRHHWLKAWKVGERFAAHHRSPTGDA